MTYLIVKSLHVIAVIAWMAAMLYLPRLFVYHAEASEAAVRETLKTMEYRLLRYICNPAMIATFIFGVAMILMNPEILQQGWLHAKIVLVFGMAGLHGFFSKCRKDFLKDANTRSPKFYRILNEIPTALMIGIVFLVIVRPF